MTTVLWIYRTGNTTTRNTCNYRLLVSFGVIYILMRVSFTFPSDNRIMEALGQLFWSVSHNLENIRSKTQLTFDIEKANMFVRAVEKPRIHFP